MINERLCIFCGLKPINKTNEHVLPQWLITLTGHPKRIVNFGPNPLSGELLRFDWSSFKFPSCKNCNNKSAILEGEAQRVINKLISREPIELQESVTLFDWLDKIRIGLWLGYSYLHKNPAQISHSFHINDRIGKKDRMLAIYSLDSTNRGLNIWGAETLTFQLKPSCLGIRINNIYILNMSWDFMCSKRCGFPYPKIIQKDSEGFFAISNLKKNNSYKNPILAFPFIKPSIHLYQPVCSEEIFKKFKFPFITNSPIFIQLENGAEKIQEPHSLINFQIIKPHQVKPQNRLISQTYDFQFKSFLIDQKIYLPDLEMNYLKILKKENKIRVKIFYNITAAQYKDVWNNSTE